VSLAWDATLWLHVATGFAALFAGLGAIVTRKGGRRHRLAGRTYVASMAVVSGTAVGLYAVRPSFTRLLLGLVAVFSFYFAFSGYRVLSRRRPSDTPGRVDWAAVALFGGSSLLLAAFGAREALAGADFGTVVLVFGGIGVVFGANDARWLGRDPAAAERLPEHLTRMGAGYIATVSAFSAVNFQFLPFVLRWLWPTLLGTPLLVYARRAYETKSER
jgi:hypothetical protein